MCNCEDKKVRVTDYRQRLDVIPNAIQSKLKAKLEVEQLKQDLQNSMKVIEIRIKQEVSEMVDGDGKKFYTNQEQRENASFKRMENDTEYRSIKVEFIVQSQVSQALDADIDTLKIKLKVLIALIDLEKLEE
jgi:hypothetical protein